MEDLPKTSKSKTILLGLVLFFLGAAIGAGTFYFYTIKVMIPKYQAEMTSKMFKEQEVDWSSFFQKVEEEKGEEEFVNPFEGAEETGEEEYVNPFELIE